MVCVYWVGLLGGLADDPDVGLIPGVAFAGAELHELADNDFDFRFHFHLLG